MKGLIPLPLNSLHHSVVQDQLHHMTWTLVRNAQLQTPSQTPWIRNSGVGPSRPCFNKLSGWFWGLWKTWRTTGLWHPCQMVAWLTSAWPLVMERSLPLSICLNTFAQIKFHVIFLSSVLILPVTLKVKVAQSWPTVCDPMDYTVHGILQARILEWVAFPFSRGSSQPRDQIQVSYIVGGFFTSWATREAQEYWNG